MLLAVGKNKEPNLHNLRCTDYIKGDKTLTFPLPNNPPIQLDSAMSLIQAAKNLMNAVVSTVKASYVASTKYQKNRGMEALNMPAISWKMKAPEKKPLVKREKQDDGQTNRVKRSSHKKHVNPVQALSEFKAMDSI